MSHSELVTVGRAYGIAEAALAIGRLEAAGITVFPQAWYTLGASWNWTFAIGGNELCVPASQADDALAVLAGFQVTTRPKGPLRRLMIALASVIVLILIAFPPPPSGFFVAARRANPTPAAGPAADPS